MATMINERCINCGACEPVCPADGISKGDGGGFIVDPARCTECVGFRAKQQCMAVCPIAQCCVPNPDRIETEEVLFERALKLFADGDVQLPTLTPKTSHFRVGMSRPWWKQLFSERQDGPPPASPISRVASTGVVNDSRPLAPTENRKVDNTPR